MLKDILYFRWEVDSIWWPKIVKLKKTFKDIILNIFLYEVIEGKMYIKYLKDIGLYPLNIENKTIQLMKRSEMR